MGGTGLISSAVTPLLVAAGHDVTLVTRGTSQVAQTPEGAHAIHADAMDAGSLRSALRGRRLRGEGFDAVVQWVGFTPDHVAADVETFRGLTDQYVYISSASAYEKPPTSYLVRESETPLSNPHWQYSRDKIACEAVLRASGLPFTIIRPSLTYGYSNPALAVNSWALPYTAIDRMRRGAPVIIHGDGTNLWPMTDHRDFARGLAGLLGNPAAIGEDFHITSDEAPSWNQIYAWAADAAGLDAESFQRQVVHVATDRLVEESAEEFEGSIRGDKGNSVVFDNSKIKAAVPGWSADIPYAEGVRESIAWFDADASRRVVDGGFNELCDRIAARWT